MATSTLDSPPIGSLSSMPPGAARVRVAAPPRVPPSVRAPEPDALNAYLVTTRSWHRHPVDLPRSVTYALWVVLAGAGAVGGWLVTTRSAPHSGLLYGIATLGHPGLLVILAGICAVTLAGLAPFTRGFTHAGGPELGAMTLAGIAGGGSLLGVVAVVVLSVVAAFLAVALFVAVVERT